MEKARMTLIACQASCLDRTASLSDSRISSADVEAHEGLMACGRCRAGSHAGVQVAERAGCKGLANLNRQQRAIEDAKLVDVTSLETVVSHPLTNADRVTTAAGHLASQVISDDFGGRRVAVDEDL